MGMHGPLETRGEAMYPGEIKVYCSVDIMTKVPLPDCFL